MSDDLKESRAMRLFKIKTEASLSRIKNQQDFRQDKMVNAVFVSAHELFSTKLDQASTAWLLNRGGQLTGIYAYLGNLSADARAKRDIFEQKRDEVMSEFIVNSQDTKITRARSQAKLDVAELDDFVIEAEHDKNNLENLLNATERMIGFIQSAIKTKDGDRFRSRDMQDAPTGR